LPLIHPAGSIFGGAERGGKSKPGRRWRTLLVTIGGVRAGLLEMFKTIEELNESSMTLQGACSGVYFLFHDNELVYIGQGWNCLLRVAEHTRKDSEKIFDRWSYIQIDGEAERKDVERELVKKLKPKYNRKLS